MRMEAQLGDQRDAAIRSEAAAWVLRLDAPEASAADGVACEEWLARDPRHARAFREAQLVFHGACHALRLSAPVRRPALRRRSAWMASAVVAAGILLFFTLDGPVRLQADVVAGLDEQPTLTLPDGSTVQLDSASAIAVTFDATRRDVRLLRGEAYFRVVADAGRPFTVQAAGGSSTALGTEFDVRLMAEGAEVGVMQHAVRVVAPVSGGPAQEATLREGQQVVYGSDGRLGAIRGADPAAIAAWRGGTLVVENATLASVVERLGRRTRTRIVIATDTLARRRISGSFDISDPLAALTVLERTLGIGSTRLGGLVIVLHS
ncbi:FecR family protein [Roseococcus pinisoli]|uniref:FecR family protein n=1 Tax=Roseococcus pinisoli TaxID=2835040 RepID=A0ABS5Q9Q0_9PROT|nr:FecR family protein [Roseococcus pinisoli]MBS7810439.1 FecR family protein [Roseococcus pinisoli]